MHFSTIMGAFALALLVGCAAPVKADKFLPTLSRNSKLYESACTEGNLITLKASLVKAKVKNHDQVWKMISTILCATPSPSNQKYLSGILSPTIQVVSGDLDGETTELIHKKDVILADLFIRGAAFALRLSKDDINELTLHFYVDEACAASRTFEITAGHWRLKSMGLGCD